MSLALIVGPRTTLPDTTMVTGFALGVEDGNPATTKKHEPRRMMGCRATNGSRQNLGI